MYILYIVHNFLEDYPTYTVHVTFMISYYLSLYLHCTCIYMYIVYYPHVPIQLGERRIRVHSLCLPVSDQLPQLYAGINLLATTAVLAKMGESNNY